MHCTIDRFRREFSARYFSTVGQEGQDRGSRVEPHLSLVSLRADHRFQRQISICETYREELK